MKRYILFFLFFSYLSTLAELPMKIVCILHADFEGPGVIQQWAKDHNYSFKTYKPYEGQSLPATDEFDTLIVMGGPQSACNLESYPYLFQEIDLIKRAIEQNKIVLGFCLGAQLIGNALGAPAQRSPEKEIGLYPITLTQEASSDFLLKGFPQTLPVIHWHNDMPSLTPEAQLLAFSPGCPRQIIRYAKKVYGFQCHLEITEEGIEQLIAAEGDSLKAQKYVQTPEQLRKNNYAEINTYMLQILDRLVTLHTINPKYPSCVGTNSYGKCLRAERDLEPGTIVATADLEKTDKAYIANQPEHIHVALMDLDEKGNPIWGTVKGKWAFCNHSCDPNCDISDQWEIITNRPIKKGQELTTSYDAFVHNFPWPQTWNFECKCEADNCKKLINKYRTDIIYPIKPKTVSISL